jgi:hypothetical protein
MTALLELIPAVRTGIKYPGGSYKSERHFLDFAIDGQSLWEKLQMPDMVSVWFAKTLADFEINDIAALPATVLL